MFFEAVAIGLLIGYIRGGRMLNIGNMHIRGWILIIVSFVLQTLPIFLSAIPVVDTYGHVISFTAMILMFVVVIINIDKKGFWLVALGALMNLLAMGFNGLLMPVNLEGFSYIGLADIVEGVKSGEVINYISLEYVSDWTQNLGKMITLPKYYPLAKVISIGDLVMSLGVFWFTQSEMLEAYHFKSRSKMVHYSINSKW